MHQINRGIHAAGASPFIITPVINATGHGSSKAKAVTRPTPVIVKSKGMSE